MSVCVCVSVSVYVSVSVSVTVSVSVSSSVCECTMVHMYAWFRSQYTNEGTHGIFEISRGALGLIYTYWDSFIRDT